MTSKHDIKRNLTPSERKEIASAFGWKDVDGVGGNLVGCRPMYDSDGNQYAWLDDERLPLYSYEILRYVRLNNIHDC